MINTDPRLVHATVLALRDMGAASVTVGEGPGHRRDTEYVIRTSGLLDALKDVDVSFTDLNTAGVVRQTLQSFYTPLGAIWLPQPVSQADVVISMPKMKTHHWAGATLSMKNCFGCMPGRVYGWPKNVLHWAGIDTSIIDVSAAVMPEYQIVDGIVAMEGNGPIQGTPKDMGLLVFGTDMVATDATAARLMGFDPERIPYLNEAGTFLGQVHLEEIRQSRRRPRGARAGLRGAAAVRELQGRRGAHLRKHWRRGGLSADQTGRSERAQPHPVAHRHHLSEVVEAVPDVFPRDEERCRLAVPHSEEPGRCALRDTRELAEALRRIRHRVERVEIEPVEDHPGALGDGGRVGVEVLELEHRR